MKLDNILKLFISYAIVAGFGYLLNVFWPFESLPKIGVSFLYQYLVFGFNITLIFSMASCCNIYKITTVNTLIGFIAGLIKIFFLTVGEKHFHYLIFFPIISLLITLIFNIFWLKSVSKNSRSLQFSLISSLFYSFVVLLIYKILQNNFGKSDFLNFFLESLGMFIVIIASLIIANIIFRYNQKKVIEEELED